MGWKWAGWWGSLCHGPWPDHIYIWSFVYILCITCPYHYSLEVMQCIENITFSVFSLEPIWKQCFISKISTYPICTICHEICHSESFLAIGEQSPLATRRPCSEGPGRVTLPHARPTASGCGLWPHIFCKFADLHCSC